MKIVKRVRRSWIALLMLAPLAACGGAEAGQRFTLVGEEKEVRGRVVDTQLTQCGPEPGKPGTCEGTLVLEPSSGGEGQRITLEVTRDVALQKGGQTVFLPQLQGSEVTARYRGSEEGQNVATSVVAAS
jgi:uncharacterized lipoprotein YehR (DUF1307 family)